LSHISGIPGLSGEGSWLEIPILGGIGPPGEKIVFFNRLDLYRTPPQRIPASAFTNQGRFDPALRAGGKAYPCAVPAFSGVALARPNGTGAVGRCSVLNLRTSKPCLKRPRFGSLRTLKGRAGSPRGCRAPSTRPSLLWLTGDAAQSSQPSMRPSLLCSTRGMSWARGTSVPSFLREDSGVMNGTGTTLPGAKKAV